MAIQHIGRRHELRRQLILMTLLVGSLNWGDIPTWLAMIAAAGAFGVSLYLLSLQRDDLKQVRDEKRREQARLIAAWPVLIIRDPGVVTAELAFGYRNASAEPAYAVAVGTRDRRTDRGLTWKELGTVAPMREREERILLSLNPEFNITADDLGIVMTFRDAMGRIWYRDEVGTLQELPYYPAPERNAILPGSTRLRPTPPPPRPDPPTDPTQLGLSK